MDSEVLRSVKVRGRPLERTLEPRRKRTHSARTRSGSRKSKHIDHFYQRLYGGNTKPVRTASMLAFMAGSPFFIVFMQVPLPLHSFCISFTSFFQHVKPLPAYALHIVATFEIKAAILLYYWDCSAQYSACLCLHSHMSGFKAVKHGHLSHLSSCRIPVGPDSHDLSLALKLTEHLLLLR